MNANLPGPALPALPLHLAQSFAMVDYPLAAASVEAGVFEAPGFYL